MNERTARTARGNRIGLGLTGVLVAAGGGYLVARSLGAFGQLQAADPVYSSGTAEWVHAQRPWLWITIAAVAVVLAIAATRWLLVQLRSDGLSRIAVDAHRVTEPGSGRTDLPAHVLARAVGQDIESYAGVSKVHAGVTGRPDQPELRLRVTVDPDADLARVRRQITGKAIANARTALDTQHLPTQLRLIVGRRAQPRRNEI